MSDLAYRHKQKSSFMLALLMALAIVMLVSALLPGMSLVLRFIFVALSVMMAGLAAIFSCLTVIVDQTHLRWHFGLGFWKKAVALSDIAAADVVRTKWWYGWGIRLTPRGWLYNVSGLDAVAVRLRSGKRFMIGTDEPAALHAALQYER